MTHADDDRAQALDMALADSQRAERAELAADIARQQAADERIIAALAADLHAPPARR